MISPTEVRERARRAVIEASTTFRPDQQDAYRRAIAHCEDGGARWVLEQLLANAEVAGQERRPLCDDTGIPHVFLEVGEGAVLGGAHLAAIAEGIARGQQELPTRAMGVLGDDRQRIEQSAGLSADPGAVVPPAFVVRPVPGTGVRLTVLMLGGGPEIRARTFRVFHRRSLESFLSTAVEWAQEGTGLLGCTPSVLAIGIGRTHYEASTLMLEALVRGDLSRQNEWERSVTERVNRGGAGPLGLGVGPTVLGTFLRIGPQRASGIRVMCLRPGCCMDPRRATVELGE
jgi:fumarate hydratase subunit alpha